MTDPLSTVCKTCKDTHRMTLGEREVPCTHCPRPCEECRGLYQGVRLGAYCQATPCPCGCHKRRSGSDLPAGWQPVRQAYRKGDRIVTLGVPTSEAHNCDAMGCGSMYHVVAIARVIHE